MTISPAKQSIFRSQNGFVMPKFATYDLRVLYIPVIITNSSPMTIVKYLYSSLSAPVSISKPQGLIWKENYPWYFLSNVKENVTFFRLVHIFKEQTSITFYTWGWYWCIFADDSYIFPSEAIVTSPSTMATRRDALFITNNELSSCLNNFSNLALQYSDFNTNIFLTGLHRHWCLYSRM